MPKNRSILRLELDQDKPGPRHVEAWRENVSPLWEVSTGQEAASRFRASSNVHHLGRSILGQVRVSGHQIQRSPALIARMGVDHILVQYRQSGAFHAEADGRVLDAAPGDVCLFDMTRPLVAWSTDYAGTTLALPRGLIAPFMPDVDAVHGTVIRGASALGALAGEHLRALSANAARFSPQEAEAAIKGTAALLAACAGQEPAPTQAVRATAEPAILLALRRFIESNLTAPDLTADRLARQFGLSRSALYRSFEPLGGVAGHIRRRRLARAYRELAVCDGQNSPRIQDVARRWQFESITTFDHAFKREFGVTPRKVRSEALAERATLMSLPTTHQRTDLYRWVLDLAA